MESLRHPEVKTGQCLHLTVVEESCDDKYTELEVEVETFILKDPSPNEDDACLIGFCVSILQLSERKLPTYLKTIASGLSEMLKVGV